MIILTSQEFNSLTKIAQKALKEFGYSVKTSRLKDDIAHSCGYKTANGLLHDLPCFLTFKNLNKKTFEKVLLEKHNVKLPDFSKLFNLMDYYMNNSLHSRELLKSEFRVDYSGMKGIGSGALNAKGEGLLEDGIPFLVIMPEQLVIYPQIITNMEKLSVPNNDMYQRLQLPNGLSFPDIQGFLNRDETIFNLSQLKAGFIIDSSSGTFRYGKLTKNAKQAVESLKNDICRLLGKPEPITLSL
jgi:hypothetical protein